MEDFNKLWDYSNPEGTRTKFLKILEFSGDGDSKNDVLELKTQIARTFSLQANFEEAHKILDEIETNLDDSTMVAKVRYFLERGRTFNSNNEKEKAKGLFVQAYELGKEIGVATYSIDGAHMVAIAVSELNEKLEWNQKGIEESKKSDDTSVKKWIGVFHNNMGWDLFEAKRYDEALSHFKACWNFYDELGQKERLDIAIWSYAKTKRLLGDLEEALKLQSQLLNEKNGEDRSGYGYEELGEIYLEKGETDLSLKYFGLAYDILSKDIWLKKHESDRLERMNSLSQSK